MLNTIITTPRINEVTGTIFPMEEHHAELISLAAKMTERGSLLFPMELITAKVEECKTFKEIQELELKMRKNRKLETLGSKARIWDRLI